MENLMYRHGDLLICSTSEIPEGAIQRKTNVILEGTATGHAHVLNNGLVLEKEGAIYLLANDGATVTHEEHNTIPLPEGNYSVTRQIEYDPYEKAARQVLD